LFVGIAGLYFWPWLADRYGWRNLLAINIALFSLLMPVVALAPSFAVFVVGRSVVNFALNGEWSLGSLPVSRAISSEFATPYACAEDPSIVGLSM
jgi:MFS family permease